MKTLYHYTAAEHLEGIKREGITLGYLPIWMGDRILLKPNYQWLTTAPQWAQPWNTQTYTTFDRTAWRCTVFVPKRAERNLVRWRELAKRMRLSQDAIAAMNMAGEVDDSRWWVYAGSIPPSWIVHWEKRPALKEAA